MTTSLPFDTTPSAPEQDLAEARELTSDLLREAGSGGTPLIEVLQDVTRQGPDLSAVSTAITEMLQAGEVDLTSDRRLHLAESDQ